MNFTIMGFGIFLRASTQLIVLIVSSRMFPLGDIGTAAILFAIYHLVWPWFEVAIGQSYFQVGNGDDKHFESLCMLARLSGLFAILVVLCLTFIFESLAPNNGLIISMLMAGAIAARSFSILSNTDLLKTLQIKLHTAIEQGSYIAGYLLALAFSAVFNLGELHLIIGVVFHSLFSSLFFHIYNVVNIPAKFHGKVTWKALHLAGGYFIASGLNTFIREIYIILIGIIISTPAAAFYSRALQIYMLGVFTIGQVFDKLLTPMFRRNIVRGVDNSRLFDLSTFIIISGFIPVSAFLFLNADTIIILLFGPKWIISVPILQILTIGLVLRTCSKINEAAMRAYGMAWQRVNHYILWVAVLLLGAFPASQFGVAGFACVETLGVVIFWLLSSRSANRLTKRNWHTQIKGLKSSIPVLLLYVIFHYVLREFLIVNLPALLVMEIIIIVVLVFMQIAIVTKLRYRNLNALRQFI
jgi:teichuronic acid exporter